MKALSIEIYYGVNPFADQSCVVFYLNGDKTTAQNLLLTLTHLKKLYENITSTIIETTDKLIVYTPFPWLFEALKKDIAKSVSKSPLKNEVIWQNIKEIIKYQLGSATYKIVLDALVAKQIPFFPIRYRNKRIFQIGYGKGSTHFQAAATPKDSAFGFKTQQSKDLTNEMAEQLDIPVPMWFLVNTLSELKKAYRKFNGKDIVLKPYNMTRGIGVYVGIKNEADAIQKFREIKKIYAQKKYPLEKRFILMQERVYGNDYRILTLDGKLEIATQRIPAHVIGDGIHTINELVKTENRNPLRDKKNLFTVLKPINIDNILLEIINDQGFDLNDIPAKSKLVWLRKAASVSQGGFTKDVTKLVHPQIKHFCETAASFMRSHVTGIDIMCEDISKPLGKHQSGGLIEVNTKPEMYLNVFPAEGRQYNDFGSKFVSSIYPESSTRTPVIVIKGTITPKEFSSRITEIKELSHLGKVAIVTSSGVWISEKKRTYQVSESIPISDAYVRYASNNTIDGFVIVTGEDSSWLSCGLYFEYANEVKL